MEHMTLAPAVLAQVSAMSIFQNEMFKVCCDVFGFICDGKDLMLMTVVPAAHVIHRHVIHPLAARLKGEADGE